MAILYYPQGNFLGTRSSANPGYEQLIIANSPNNRVLAGPGFFGISRGDMIFSAFNGLGAASFERFAPNTTTSSLSSFPIYPVFYVSSPNSGYYSSITVIKSV